MSVKHIGTTAAALTLGLALIASASVGAVPLGTVAAEIDAAIDSSVIQVAQRGGPGSPNTFRRGPGGPGGPGIGLRRGPGGPGIGIRRGPGGPGIGIRRGPGGPGIGLRRGPGIGLRRGPGIGRIARIRPGFFRSGRRLWVYPALGAGLLALTLAPGWYWGDYYDDCQRWIIPCPGCAPALVDLCQPY